MAYICDICGKSIVYGRSQRHGRGVAGKRWSKRAQVTPRLFKPNLQKVSVIVNGVKKQMTICAKDLKKLRSVEKGKSYKGMALP